MNKNDIRICFNIHITSTVKLLNSTLYNLFICHIHILLSRLTIELALTMSITIIIAVHWLLAHWDLLGNSSSIISRATAYWVIMMGIMRSFRTILYPKDPPFWMHWCAHAKFTISNVFWINEYCNIGSGHTLWWYLTHSLNCCAWTAFREAQFSFLNNFHTYFVEITLFESDTYGSTPIFVSILNTDNNLECILLIVEDFSIIRHYTLSKLVLCIDLLEGTSTVQAWNSSRLPGVDDLLYIP